MQLAADFWKCLCLALLSVALPPVGLADGADAGPVAAEYHWAGAAPLAGNTNLVLHKAFNVPSAAAVYDLLVSRFATLLISNLGLKTNPPAEPLLKPLVADFLSTESLGSFASSSTNHLSFILALRLDARRAQVWKENLGKAFGGAGEKITAGELVGRSWTLAGSDPLWILPAGDWLLAGRVRRSCQSAPDTWMNSKMVAALALP